MLNFTGVVEQTALKMKRPIRTYRVSTYDDRP